MSAPTGRPSVVLLGLAPLALLPMAVGAQDPANLARRLSFETHHRGTSPAGWMVNPPGSAVVDSTCKCSPHRLPFSISPDS